MLNIACEDFYTFKKKLEFSIHGMKILSLYFIYCHLFIVKTQGKFP